MAVQFLFIGIPAMIFINLSNREVQSVLILVNQYEIMLAVYGSEMVAQW